MTLVFMWLYTLFLIFIWGFFIVAKLHSYKFKNFSTAIIPVTRILLIFLIILSVLGYVMIFFIKIDPPDTVNVLDKFKNNTNTVIEVEKIQTNQKTVPTKSDYESIDFNEINY